MDEKVRVLEDVARNLFANVVWTHKIQDKQRFMSTVSNGCL